MADRFRAGVTMWSGTARFRNPHIKWQEAMAGIPLELQVEKRKEGKRESKETKRKSKAYIHRPGHVTCHVTNMWPVTWVRKTWYRNKVYIYMPSQARPRDLSRHQHMTCHMTNMWSVTAGLSLSLPVFSISHTSGLISLSENKSLTFILFKLIKYSPVASLNCSKTSSQKSKQGKWLSRYQKSIFLLIFYYNY